MNIVVTVLALTIPTNPEDLVAQLGSPDFRTRELAASKLIRQYKTADQAITQGYALRNPEISRRLNDIKAQIHIRKHQAAYFLTHTMYPTDEQLPCIDAAWYHPAYGYQPQNAIESLYREQYVEFLHGDSECRKAQEGSNVPWMPYRAVTRKLLINLAISGHTEEEIGVFVSKLWVRDLQAHIKNGQTALTWPGPLEILNSYPADKLRGDTSDGPWYPPIGDGPP